MRCFHATLALVKRMRGSGAHAMSNQVSNAAGMLGSTKLPLGWWPSWMRSKSSPSELPVNGGRPVRHSKATTPNAQMSARRSTSAGLRTCSGAM